MDHGFLRVSAVTPDIRVCDCSYNENSIKAKITDAYKKKIKLLVFPELCISGYTCEDMFFQECLINASLKSLFSILEFSKDFKMIIVVGVAIQQRSHLYNCAAVICEGELLGIIPKTYLSNKFEQREFRYFTSALDTQSDTILLNGKHYPFGRDLIFRCKSMPDFTFAVEISGNNEDIYLLSSDYTHSGVNIIINLSATAEQIGMATKRERFIKQLSEDLICSYILAGAGEGESTTNAVFSGHNIIAENGEVLSMSKPFENSMIYSEIDLHLLKNLRNRNKYIIDNAEGQYREINFDIPYETTPLSRGIPKNPFIENNAEDLEQICKTAMNIQSNSLEKRMLHTKSEKLVLGISGGLDSTLALLVSLRAMNDLQYDPGNIVAITMPCFGTSDRTLRNSKILCNILGVSLKEINIKEDVIKHFETISHDLDDINITYENAQARIRTLVLMDVANEVGGIVVGTGDMSELALGWATYNGDHMSMYSVNAGIPKTMMKYIIDYEAKQYNSKDLLKVLEDIIETPISPELLPSNGENMSQKTESQVGPYELHDFFMYFIVYTGFATEKVFYLATKAFDGKYSNDTIKKWLKIFCRRFFAQQFKRSCSPDGAKVNSFSFSPRGDFLMPSDAVSNLWLDDIE